MIAPKQIEELVKSIIDTLPPGVGQLPEQMQQNLKASLSSAFAKLDLVTREEFEIQKGVLLKTREKLEALEQHVAKLEQSQQTPIETESDIT